MSRRKLIIFIDFGLCRKRVFILGPSHYVHFDSCALSPAMIYNTPLYDMNVDKQGDVTNDFGSRFRMHVHEELEEHPLAFQSTMS